MDTLSFLRPLQPILWIIAAVGLLGINGVFLYFAVLDPALMSDALANPVAAIFMVEAFLMVAFGAVIIARLGLERPGWVAFIVLSILGSLAFSVPAFILLHLRKRGPER